MTEASLVHSSPASTIAPRRLLSLSVVLVLSLTAALCFAFIVHYGAVLASSTEENNKRINLAGRQRALSQRMTKALLSYERDIRSGLGGDAALTELRKISSLFDAVIKGFEQGGLVPGTDGREFVMRKVSDPEEVRVIREALELWLPLRERIAEVASGKADPGLIASAVEACRARNVAIFDLMNELTNRTEVTARDQINQAAGRRNIFIGITSVSIILIPGWLLWARARDSRLRAEAALHSLESVHAVLGSQTADLATTKQETDRIMDTVQEGLLLIDANYIIGPTHSRELVGILRQDSLSGLSLLGLLQRLLSEKMYLTTKEYFELLFDASHKEKTVLSVNPLIDLEVSFSNPAGGFIHRYLGFSFRRIVEGGRVTRVFVAVRDITAQVELERKLRESEQVKERQLQILLGIIHVDPNELDRFSGLLEAELESISSVLRAEDFTEIGRRSEGLRDRLDAVFRSVHNIKGNAAYLHLDIFAKTAEEFESRLTELRGRPLLSGDDFLSVVVSQARLASDLGDLMEMRGKLSVLQSSSSSSVVARPSSGESIEAGLKSFVSGLSKELAREVDVSVDTYALHVFAKAREDLVRDVLIQLARNSLVHGVESAEERSGQGKPARSQIIVRGLPRTAEGLLGISFRDDGRGLDLNRIRARAETQGLLKQGAVASSEELARLIFTPGFSTANNSDHNAGRGVGMDIVKSRVVDEARGSLELQSVPGRFCEFSIYLPESAQPLAA